MIPQVAHSPASLVIEMSSTSLTGRGLLQSMPVEARRCTLSTKIDQSTIGPPENSTVASAA